ncbi:response regulator transcription factor [Streptomyces sp. TRM66268-LWL]|uniref:Response regulator transcription factor n=1 Tax=Streptomyces polyasparticus TaxID=2767826 RepID=A0ABR7SYF0_9ACTN|nr:response regulator transcription factor [Streptomyces polyasparticus]MBC9719576.1 response regulator transcription factor [Streptomyces polyasparticus]
MRVLVVEDDPLIAEMVTMGLRRHGFAVDTVLDGAAAAHILQTNDYDVVVLDRDLPGVHGDAIATELVSSGARTRILMLTASGGLGDRVQGLNLGADDYLAKPFEYPELIARVGALCRRSAPPLPPVMESSGVRLDTSRRTVTRDGQPLDLTPKEFAVLHLLLAADGAPVSPEELLERAWDQHADPFTSAVRVTMSRLRTKLGAPPLIRTVPGVGYVL